MPRQAALASYREKQSHIRMFDSDLTNKHITLVCI